MFTSILVGLDGSLQAQQAFRVALALAKTEGAGLTALAVEERLPAYAASLGEVEDAQAAMSEYFGKVLAGAQAQAQAAGLSLDTAILPGHAAVTIVRYATENGHDLIILGQSGHAGAWKSAIGSTADKVADQAPCSVLIVKMSPETMRVGQVMTCQVVTATPQTPLPQVVRSLAENLFKAVPVVDEAGRVVGIITGGDLLERAGLGLRPSLHPVVNGNAAEALRVPSSQTAADVMSSPVTTTHPEALLMAAAREMVRQGCKRLPAVDAGGKLVGIVSRLDVLRIMAAAPMNEEPNSLPPVRAGSVIERMSTKVPMVGTETPLADLLSTICGSPLRLAVVVDRHGHVSGIVTDGDLLARVAPAAQPGIIQGLMGRLGLGSHQSLKTTGETAGDLMTHAVVTASVDASLTDIMKLMVERKVKRLPVVDKEGRLLGLLDRASVFQAAVADADR